MSKKYFTDAVSEQTIIDLTGEMLKEEAMNKNLSKPRLNAALLKIIPAAAMIALVIGLINILPAILNNTNMPGDDINSNPGVFAAVNNPGEEIELFLPMIVEKTFFEERVLAAIPKETVLKIRDKMQAYYTLKDPSDPNITERARAELLEELPFTKEFPVYVFDPNASQREKDQILELFRYHTDITGNDLMHMFSQYGVLYSDIYAEPYDRHAHVRFGETRDILLLDIEWHTYETYRELLEMSRDSAGDLPVSAFENSLESINQGRYYTRTINGKIQNLGFGIENGFMVETATLSKYTDSDGYYMWRVFPYAPFVAYYDEDEEWQHENFSIAASKSSYERILTGAIIPYCDDLLARGLITQEEYDRLTISDILDYYVGLWF
jgi:hypothetical protein